MSIDVIGALNARGELFAPIDTPDEAGGFSRAFESRGFAWFAFDEVSLTEAELPDRRAARANLRIQMRADIAIEPGWRLLIDGRALVVTAIGPTDRNGRKILLTREDQT